MHVEHCIDRVNSEILHRCVRSLNIHERYNKATTTDTLNNYKIVVRSSDDKMTVPKSTGIRLGLSGW